MRKILITVSLCVFSLVSFSQKDIKVSSKNYTIEKIERHGLATTIELDKKFVKKNWEKFIKNYGKVESKKNTFTVGVAEISAISSNTVKLYSAVESSGKGTMVWMAIDMGSKYVVEGEQGYSAAEDILRDFTKSCYRADIEEQAKEAEKALETATKKEAKVKKEGEKLASELESNAKEKVKLENDLQENGKKKTELEGDISQNDKDYKSASEEKAKMQKAFDLKQAELSKYQ